MTPFSRKKQYFQKEQQPDSNGQQQQQQDEEQEKQQLTTTIEMVSPTSPTSPGTQESPEDHWKKLTLRERSSPMRYRIMVEEFQRPLEFHRLGYIPVEIKVIRGRNYGFDLKDTNAILKEEIDRNSHLINESDDVPDSESDELTKEWMVEKIVSKKCVNGLLAYEAKWENYDSSDNTHEKLPHLDNSLILVKSFENSFLNYFHLRENQAPQLVEKYQDKKTEYEVHIWRKLSHLTDPDEILAYDHATKTCLVSFKNIGEVAKVSLSELEKKPELAKLFVDFHRKHRKEFLCGNIKNRHIPTSSNSQTFRSPNS